MTAVRWAVVLSDDLDALERLALRALWDAAFAGRFSDDDEVHAFGGVHVIARDGLGRPVVHASAVPRRLRVGDVWWEAGYVEAVAVAPEHQHEGLGTIAMELLGDQIAGRFPFAMLSTGSHGFYTRLGWQRWQGRSFTLDADGRCRPDDEHGGLLVLPLDSGIDPSLDVTCEDRSGDAW